MVNLFLTGPIFIGVKLIGDHFVPSGEESTRVNTTDSAVRQNINFDQDSEKEMQSYLTLASNELLYFFQAKAKWAKKGYKNPK